MVDGSVTSGNLICENGAEVIDSASYFSTGSALIVDNAVTEDAGQAFFLLPSDDDAREVFRGNGPGAQVSVAIEIGSNRCGPALCPRATDRAPRAAERSAVGRS